MYYIPSYYIQLLMELSGFTNNGSKTSQKKDAILSIYIMFVWLVNKTDRPTNRTTLPAFKHWHKDSEVLPSGLLGPVKIVVYKVDE